VPIREVARDLPLQLLKAPTLQVLEHLKTKHDFGGRTVAPSPRGLRTTPSQYLVHPIDELLVVEQRVDESQNRIHQILGLAQGGGEHHFRESHLHVAPSGHRAPQRKFHSLIVDPCTREIRIHHPHGCLATSPPARLPEGQGERIIHCAQTVFVHPCAGRHLMEHISLIPGPSPGGRRESMAHGSRSPLLPPGEGAGG
jgi:hypothetical protein